MDDYRLQQTGQEVQDILNGAAMQTSLDEEVLRAKQAENTLQSNIDNEELARQGADTTLQQNIDAEKTRAEGAEGANSTRITTIEGKIPTQASPTNQLADKDFVNSSIANSTATFRGTYNLLTDLELSLDATTEQIAAKLPDVISHPKKNEYCFVQIPTSTEVPTQIAKIERYKYSGQAWDFEYDLNNSSFTSDQWAAINSGITSDLVTKLGALPTASELATALLGKQDVLQYDELPANGSQKMVKSGGIYTAIKNSSDALSTVIDGILAMIPSAASALNQLADKAFVNSSISTATATFRGTYNLVTDLELAIDATHEQIAIALDELVTTADNNDYCFVQVPTSTDTPTEIAKTERYKFNGSHWAFEYELNTSGFTAAQWSAINSGITAVLTGKLSDLPTASELSAAFTAITDLIPSEATAQNQLADKAYVLSQILAAIPVFKGQFTTLAELQTVASPTDGDLGIVRTKDFDGLDVFTFYQYLNSQWNVFYTLQNHPQTKPASTGTTGDYPYNGMGRVVLEKNMQNIAGAGEPENIVCLLTQDMFNKGPAGSRVPNENTIFVIRYDYVLDSDITIPANCVLEFDGGSISGAYTIEGQNTGIIAPLTKIFNTNVLFDGTWSVLEAYPEWFGAVGDNSTDDYSSLTALANSPFDNIRFAENKTYKSTQSVQFKKDVNIDGNHSSLQFIYVNAGYDGLVFGKDNSLTELTSITSITGSAGTNTLTVNSASGLQVGDTVMILDNKDRSWSPDTERNYKAGDIFNVTGISGTTVTLNEYLTQDYNNGSYIKLYKINTIKVNLRNIHISGQFTDSVKTSTINPLYIIGGSDCRFENITLDGSNIFHLGTDYCYNIFISNVRIDQNSSNVNYNYGIHIGCSKNVQIADCNITVARHGVALGGGHYGNDVVIPNRYIEISDSVFNSYTNQSCLDSHGNAQFVTVDNCIVKNGISMEASDFKITNCNIASTNNPVALLVKGNVYSRGLISNNTIKGSTYDTSTYSGGICIDHLNTDHTLPSDTIAIYNNIFKCKGTHKRGGNIVLFGGQGNGIVIDGNSFENNSEFNSDSLKFYEDANLNVTITNNKGLIINARDLQNNACQYLKLDIRNNEITYMSYDGACGKMSLVNNNINLTTNGSFVIQNSKSNTAAGLVELIGNKIYKNVSGNYIIYINNSNLNLRVLRNNIITENINNKPIFNITANKLVYKYNKVDSDGVLSDNALNVTTLISDIGAFANKPTYSNGQAIGEQYYDTTNSRIIVWSGTAWKDATGQSVS